ncbi:MAG: segregation/condensation protein A [Rhodospirillaceae bacterium]|nr:segregation/condensation protein A [Rhodospirillaceae bacterium]HAA91726.1 segregation/condensation protein A [Rhodospirillaceae bacterium]
MTDLEFQEDSGDQRQSRSGDALVLNLDGYEGPIDLLLTLSREQKVDLTKISILQLADQYLDFIERAQDLRLEIAADYLVMAAWLAYLKSRLLLPSVKDEEGELSAAEMAARLAFQLQRLEAMRNTGKTLLERPQLDREFFRRGDPEPLEIVRTSVFEVTLFDLLRAYGAFRERENITALRIDPTQLYSTEKALGWLRQLIGDVPDWTTLENFLPPGIGKGIVRRSAVAATFAASLEMVKAGEASLRQSKPFAPLFLKAGPKTVAA